MVDQLTLVTYVTVVLGFVFIPGPATMLTMARATTSGTRVGLATGLGIAVGDVIHTALAVFGISALILASAFLFALVKYVGAAYLVYLGLCAIFEKAPGAQSAQGRAEPVRTASAQIASGQITPGQITPGQITAGQITPGQAFRQAILAEVLNPKTALFFLAFLPQFVKPENGSVFMQLSILGLILMALGLLSTVVFALAAGGIGGFLRRNPAVMRWQGKAVGAIYCALGVRLAFQER